MHEPTLEERVGVLEYQMNGNGDPGVCKRVEVIYDYVLDQKGKQAGEEKAKQDALALAAEKEARAARARSLAKWVAGGVAVVLFSIFSWAAVGLWNWIEPPAAAIIREYYEHHPKAEVNKNSSCTRSQQAYSIPVQEAHE